MGVIYSQLSEALGFLEGKVKDRIELIVVLGSAQGGCIEFDSEPTEIPYSSIPNFPSAQYAAAGHAKRFLFGKIEGVETAVMDGRLHYFEGYKGADIAFPIRLLSLMGAKTIVLTNAAGGLNPQFSVGDLMFIRDHFTLFLPLEANPLVPHETEFGETPHLPQVPGVLYDKGLIEKMKSLSGNMGISWKEGTYAFDSGPQFESGVDLKLLRLIGADAVGMSTVPEAMAAFQLGMKVAGISGITNVMSGDSNPTSDEEVKEQAGTIGPKINRLVHGLALGLE